MKIKLQEIVCEKCGHKWIPRKPEIRQCAKCKTAWFDRKKNYGQEKHNKVD